MKMMSCLVSFFRESNDVVGRMRHLNKAANLNNTPFPQKPATSIGMTGSINDSIFSKSFGPTIVNIFVCLTDATYTAMDIRYFEITKYSEKDVQ